MLAWTMAAELHKVPLADGLELLLLANDVEPARFDRAVPRWHARLCSEQQLSSGEAQQEYFGGAARQRPSLILKSRYLRSF
jgi:hypothetical protein